MIVVAVQPALSVCAGCGQRNTADARFCSACGVSLLMPPPADTLSNAVAGEPVPRAAPHPQPQIPSLPALRGRVQDALPELRDRLHEVLPEVAATLSESMQRLGGLQTTRSRPLSRGRIAAPPARPSLPLLFARWLPVPPAPVLPPPPPLPARVAWCLLAGIWLTPLWLIGTWLCLCTVVGVPLAARMLDLAPTVLTLRPPREAVARWRYREMGAGAAVPQHDPLLRALYFVFVGWWASLAWMMVAYLVSLTVIGMPAGYGMLELAPAVAHLQRR